MIFSLHLPITLSSTIPCLKMHFLSGAVVQWGTECSSDGFDTFLDCKILTRQKGEAQHAGEAEWEEKWNRRTKQDPHQRWEVDRNVPICVYLGRPALCHSCCFVPLAMQKVQLHARHNQNRAPLKILKVAARRAAPYEASTSIISNILKVSG